MPATFELWVATRSPVPLEELTALDEEFSMFNTFCPTFDHEVLLSTRQITALTNTHHGIVVEFECVCGADGVYLTGASAPSSGLVYHQHAQQLAEAS